MASSQNTQYACRCLNVRIASSAPPSAPPQDLRDRNYIPVFVKDDGISVVHPQVTIRLPSKSVSIPGTSRHSRFTTVCCLFCQLNIYRVHQTISSDVVGGEATLLPTEGWVEHEIMRSASGWIEIHKQSIVGDDIVKAENSSLFAPRFSLLLPSMSSPPSSPNLIEEEDSPQTPEPSSEATLEYLANMRPIFQPPPFTPSNPVFVHLAAIASRESGQLRATAEGRIKDFISAERAGIEAKESELRHQVEVLWKHFRQHLSTVEQERTTNVGNSLRSPIRVKEGEKSLVSGLTSPSQLSSSVAIRSFIPQPVSPTSLAPSTSAPRVSALSASLATTRFHHPRHEQQRSSGSGSSVLYGSSPNTNERDSPTLIPQQFNQNLNDYINAQTSYKVLVNEDLVRNKHSQAATMNKPDAEAAKYPKEAGPSFASPGVKPIPNGNENPGKAQVAGSQHTVAAGSKPEGETTPARGRDKGQRKVTFDIEADVVAIPNRKAVNSGEATAAEDPRDMIFALDDLDGFEIDAQQSALPLIDQPLVRPTKARRPRPPINGPQEAFSSLRPASLPNPSHMRPIRSQPGVDSSSQGIMLNLARASGSTDNGNTIPLTAPTSSTPLTENDATLLKLVAADTPSHRGAWTPESKAWQMFTRRQDSKENVVHSNIPENSEVGPTTQSSAVIAAKPVTSKMKLVFIAELDDDEDEGYVDTVPGSLPIQFHSQMQRPEPLTLASYQPTTTVSGGSSPPIPAPSNKPLSSVAIRKAAYLARDRNRSMDPGTLDFAVEEEDEDEESEESGPEQGKVEPSDAGGKGRKHALKILQARSELPSDGMWRSLA